VWGAGVESCERVLTEPQIRESAQVELMIETGQAERFLDKVALRLFRARLAEDVVRLCLDTGCSQEQIEHEVRAHVDKILGKVEKVHKRIRIIQGYSLMIGAMVASSFATTYLKATLKPGSPWGWAAELLTPLAVVGILKFGAPFWMKINAISESAAFRMRAGKSWFRDAPENEKLDVIHARMLSKFTGTQQAARSTLANAVASLRGVSKDAIDLFLKGQKEQSADRLAEVAIFMRKYLAEIPYETGSVVRTVHMILSKYLGPPEVQETYAQLVLKSISENDPDINEQGVREYYDGMIHTWLTNGPATTH
jgi:hypothetical protein